HTSQVDPRGWPGNLSEVDAFGEQRGDDVHGYRAPVLSGARRVAIDQKVYPRTRCPPTHTPRMRRSPSRATRSARASASRRPRSSRPTRRAGVVDAATRASANGTPARSTTFLTAWSMV